MSKNGVEGSRPTRLPDFVLSTDELRTVTGFNLSCALHVIGLFESSSPHDMRPRRALDAAQLFVDGAGRSNLQRATASAAHRAAKSVVPPAAHAAMAAGDAAGSAFLHPLADAAQVGHILRGPAHSVLALTLQPTSPCTREEAEASLLAAASPTLIEVLSRYPRPTRTSHPVYTVMADLDVHLRSRVHR
jgi:hypothetical protein